MDDRIEPGRPKLVGFRTYADDTFRPDWAQEEAAREARREEARREEARREGARREDERWRRARPAENDHTRNSERFAGPRGPGRLGPVVATGAMLCGAAVVGFLLARPDLRAPAEHPAASPVSRAPAPRLQVAQGASPAAQLSTASPSPSDAPPPGVRVEAPRSAPLAAPMPSPMPSPVVPRAVTSSRATVGRTRPAAPEPALAPVAREPALAAAGGHPLRVFVHISQSAELPVADQIRSELNGLRFADQPVATPPVRFVASSPRRTELRCLKHTDCPAARRLAPYLERSLRTPVEVVDMSRTYEQDPEVRPGSLELWLRP
jgi:hypothetical protein